MPPSIDAAALGFKDVYLFGLDFGARDPEAHHSRHSVYFNYESADEIATYTPYDMTIPAPANFGGQVSTGPLLMEGANVVAAAIKAAPGMTVRNCSDGIAIPLAKPCSPDSIHLPRPQWDWSGELADILSQLEYHRDAVVDADHLAESFRSGFDTFIEQAKACLAVFAESRIDDFQKFVALGDALWSMLDVVGKTHPAVRLTLYGHLHLMLQGAFLAAGALEDRDLQDGGGIIAEEIAHSLDRLRRDLHIEPTLMDAKAGTMGE